MSYVESFETFMSKARILMADCDMPFLDGLQAAHDDEMKQLSKAEYHRGYADGQTVRDADQWQLYRERTKTIEAIRRVVPNCYSGSHEMMSNICSAIYNPVLGWTAEAGRDLCDRLVYLLGGENVKLPAEPDTEFYKNGENHQFVGYDVLGNERHKVVCELRKLRERDVKIWNIEISIALGLDLDASNDDVCDRLIYLLSGDQPTLSDLYGIWRDELDSQESPNFEDSGNDDAGEITITDELRKFATDPLLGYASQELHVERITAIADRIDEQFNRICSQQEAVLQKTISDIVDEHERDMAEMWQKLSGRDAIIDNYHERMKGLDEAERRMAVAESKCKELQSRYDSLLVTCKELTSLANKYFNEVNELFSDETN